MASSRKKQDEKNLKTLRELSSYSLNKYCFDCNQRGPTYVDMTIGSFVCTKCSGILRGLTPPHRLKSISMATFTTEEIELLKSRGNDYCRNVWLGLYEGVLPTAESRDEQTIKDFMIDKYERNRYYMDPKDVKIRSIKDITIVNSSKIKPLNSLISDPKPIKINGDHTVNAEFNRKRPEPIKNNVGNPGTFAVNFDNADIFTSSNNSNNNNNNSKHRPVTADVGFANFDNNPVFENNSAKVNNTASAFSIFDLKFTHSGPVLNQVPLFPKCNTNRWSMPTPNAFENFNVTLTNNTTANNKVLTMAPLEDKYAALKDLDNALKTQNQSAAEWNSSGSNGSLYSSPTPTGSMYSSPSPQSSMFGSPSQGQFISTFQNHQDTSNAFSNPFNNGSSGVSPWGNTNGQAYPNPFRSNGFTPAVFPNGWAGANPFKVGTTATNVNSSNPFL